MEACNSCELARRKSWTDDDHRKAFVKLLAELRSEAMSNKLDGRHLGTPTFTEFLEQIAKIRDMAATGSDLIHGVLWKHSPHWFKSILFELLQERFLDLHW